VGTFPVMLNDVLELERIPVEVDPGMEYRQIGVRSFGRGIFHRDPCLGVDLGRLRYFWIEPDRLVVSNIMAWEGAVGLSTDIEHGCIGSNQFLTYRAKGEVDLRYLNYYFQTSQGRDVLRSASTGTVARNQTLSMRDFGNLKVPLPELGQQQRVAARLDDIQSSIERIEALRSQILQLWHGLRDSTISKAVNLAESRVSLEDVLELERIPVHIDHDRIYKQIGVRSFGKGIFHREPSLGSELSKLPYFEIHVNRLIVSNIMAWEGAIAVSTNHEAGYVGSSRFLSFKPTHGVDISYLHHYFQSRPGLELIRRASTETVARNQTLTVGAFKSLQVPLPDLSQQTRIATALDTLGKRIQATHSSDALALLRTTLLARAFCEL
jgi:type I restriction enzyme, S subunit